MKKLLMAVFSAALVLAAAVATAQQNQPSTRPQSDPSQTSSASAATLEGTVSQIDQSGRSFVVRDASGTETTVYWDQTTRLMSPEGSQGMTTERSGQTSSNMSNLKVGDDVVVKTTDQGGKKVAATVKVQPKKS
jgi:hypothetical protein